jgi:hypothetical protein
LFFRWISSLPEQQVLEGFFLLKLDFCKMDIGPIFFKEILFFDFLEELAQVVL